MSNQRSTFWIPLLIATLLYGIGDVLLKMGNMDIGSTFQQLFNGNFWIATISSIPIIAAFGCAFLAKLIMGVVLSKNPLSISEGVFLAFAVLTVFIMGIVFFGEDANILKAVGVILIVTGVLSVYSPRSEKQNEALGAEKNK